MGTSTRDLVHYRRLIISSMAWLPSSPSVIILLLSLLSLFTSVAVSLKAGDCEVCISVLDRFRKTLAKDQEGDAKAIEKEFVKFCKPLKTKENRFCYFLGGTADAATGILGEMSKPLSWSMPSDKICEKLKKKDRQVCELTYEKQIDFSTVDLKKLKVKDLKKILNDGTRPAMVVWRREILLKRLRRSNQSIFEV